MTQKTERAVSIDFFALSGTGKSTHSKALLKHLSDQGFKTEILSFSARRSGKNGSFGKPQRLLASKLFQSFRLGGSLWKLLPKNKSLSKLAFLMKWSYRAMTYNQKLRTQGVKGRDFVILDPSLSSKLKNFYKHFSDNTMVEVIALLEQNNLTSDVIVILEADMKIVKQRRGARGSEETAKGDKATIPIAKAFHEFCKRKTSMYVVTVNYDSFSNLNNNIQQITQVCTLAKSKLETKNTG
jgi:thymidylate kinase